MNKKLLPLLALLVGSAQLHAQPVITSQPVNPAVVWGGNATFSVMATGVGPLTYQWQLNGTNLPNNIITTLAGGNLFNNQQATNTILNIPSGPAVDNAGNLFIADTVNNVIRRVSTNGLTVIVAGNGSASFSGDGGAATNAGLASPYAVYLDSFANLLIADSNNNRIRKVDTNGVISTVAGNGTSGFSGDGGAATNAQFNSPTSVCANTNGNLYVADLGNGRIRMVDPNGIITTVAGGGAGFYNTIPMTATQAYLSAPYGVAVDSSNNLYIADSFNTCVAKVNTSGKISLFAGNKTSGYSGDGGAATSATMRTPEGVTADTAGNVFIADTFNNLVRKVGTNNIITTVAGNGTNGYSGDGGMATNANLSAPQNVSVDNFGNLFIADSGNNRIRQVGTNGVITTVVGRDVNDGEVATNATLNGAAGIAFDPLGNLYIADRLNNRVRKVDTNGIITTAVGKGLSGYSGDGGMATNAILKQPYGVAFDITGNMFIADAGNFRIRKVDTNGIISTVAGNGTNGYSGDGGVATNAKIASVYSVAVDSGGNCMIMERSGRVRKVATNGVITTVVNGASLLIDPYAVALDFSGNIIIADWYHNRVLRANFSTLAGNGTAGFSGDGGAATSASLNFPKGLAIDKSGNLFIADCLNARIRKVNTNGNITTIAGTGIAGCSGDGGPANIATIAVPYGMALDAGGNLYFVDSNNRVRKLSYLEYADQPAFTVTNVTPASSSNHYSVIITSASGSVTSSVVTVTLQLPPITPVFTASNSICTFTWSAVSNQTYQLQSATNLIAPDWVDLGSPITATNNSVSATDSVGSDEQRFYRVRLWP